MIYSQLKGLSGIQKFQLFQNSEDPVLERLPGNIYALQIAYRVLCRVLRRTGEMPAFADLPRRLTMGIGRGGRGRCGAAIDGRTYATICRRLKLELRHAAEEQLQLSTPRKVVFEDDPDLERGRRVAMYSKQVDELDRMATALDEPGDGPLSKPVYCKDLEQWFESGRQAADYVSGVVGRLIRRKDIRTAIVRRCKVADLRFSYEGPEEGRPLPKINSSGQRPVVCLEVAGEPFISVRTAAAFAGVTHTVMRKALSGNGTVGDYHFKFADQPEIAPKFKVFPSIVSDPPDFHPLFDIPTPIRKEPRKVKVRVESNLPSLFAEAV